MKLHRILTSAMFAAALTASAAGDVTLKQSLDSAYLMMGRTTTLNIELLGNGSATDGSIVVSKNAYPKEVEVSLPGTGDTTVMDNNRYQIRRQITIQSFDSGVWQLPPVLYIERGETIASNALSLKVIPVPVDTLKDIHDYAGVHDTGSKWYDSLPDWLVDYGVGILLGLLVIAGGVWAYFRYFRKKKAEGAVVKVVKKAPPYEEAVKQLNELRDEHLCENGMEREYYTRLTEILRTYLQERFGINAMEMTSSQILDELEKREETRMPRLIMNRILEMADYVKFAKVRPLPDDNINAWRSAMQFVEDTKPLPPAPAGENGDKDVKPENRP